MDIRTETHTGLKIDNIPSTQPELGSSVPDGGYGWIILVVSVFFQGLIPSISVGFGVFLLFLRLESSAPTEPALWDSNLVYVSLFFILTRIIADPAARSLCTTSTWPRLVATAGTCLTCAGLLVMWIAVNNGKPVALCVLAGFLSGTGASVVLTQTDILISQYFHLKLESVKTILNAVSSFGFILTPVLLGDNIVKIGVLQVITWYQAIILQGILLSIALKKPKHLKMHRRKYKLLIRGISDDEEDIFAKNSTELQNPRPINKTSQNNDDAIVDAEIENTATTSQKNSSGSVNGDVINVSITTSNSNIQEDKVHRSLEKTEVPSNNWVKFEDNTNNSEQTSNTRMTLHKTFATDFDSDLERIIDHSEDNHTDPFEIPKPLFSETQINNNTSYSYEQPFEVEDPVVFMPVSKSSHNFWNRSIEILKQPTFYKSLLFLITLNYSVFIFWTLFPSYLYNRVEHLQIHDTTTIVGCISIGSLFFMTLTTWIKPNEKTRAIFLWIFCWIGTLGYITLSDAIKETLLICGAVGITLSISALQTLGVPLMKINLHGESSTVHIMLSTLTGISFILFLIIDMNYKNCFRLIALLQFLTGSLWLSNFIYKKMMKHGNHR